MPNIEIHGFGYRNDDKTISLPAEVLYVWDIEYRIQELLKEKPYAKDVVTTVVLSFVRDLNCVRRPFLRIYDTDIDRAKTIGRILKEELKIDIEYLPLAGFIEAEDP